jgi:sulfur-oxidizing protein SoxY
MAILHINLEPLRRRLSPLIRKSAARNALYGVAAGCVVPRGRRHRAAVMCLAASALLSGLVHAIGEEQQPSSSAWEFLRAKYYGDKFMGMVDEKYMSLEVPSNTPDPAATPLTLRFADDEQRRIKRVRVFIDNNPSPLVATFDFASATPVTEINMRVRIDRFTSVRAVAETTDGGLEMRSAWVKASGGCSAPSSAAPGGVLGEIRLRPSTDTKSLLTSIRHPNSSGFQIDPRTGDAIPAHYISHIRIAAAGEPLVDAETGISLSENPSLRIASDRVLALPITVDALDSQTQAHFTAAWQGGPSAAAPEARRDTLTNGSR